MSLALECSRMSRAWLVLLAMCALAARADEFDELRSRWRTMIAGGDGVDLSLPQVRSRLTAIESAPGLPGAACKTPRIARRFGPISPAQTTSSHITGSYSRLKGMALAWATPGQQLYGDPALLADIRSALDWLERNRYNARVEKEYDNWWDWEIGTPLQMGDLLVLLYDRLTPEEIGRYAAAVDRFDSDPRVMITSRISTGANRVWKCHGAALRGIVVKDAAKLQLAGDALGPVFAYVTSGDGFYEDGSFIQHTRHPYTGGYGNALIAELADLMYLLSGSRWEVRDPARENVYRWVFEAFQPLVWRGAMMDMVRGREISRAGSSDHRAGHSTAAGILRVARFAPEGVARRMKSLVKEWYLSDTSGDWSSGRSLDQIMAISRLLRDDAVPARGELSGSWIFAAMDRVVHLRPGWGFGIAMHSSRIYNYESINHENLRAWHTGDGMTYLYNGDLAQFSNGFWPTIDPQRLAGTTVIAGSTARQSQLGGSEIAGGATLQGRSAVMFDLRPDGRQLNAHKSWFLLDDEVVALGSDIAAPADAVVETIVENRLVTGDPAFTRGEDGAWAHLEGVAGYFFPNGAGWKWSREERRGSWRQINAGGSDAEIVRRYHTIWFDRGKSYAYAILPNKTRAETREYAANPGFRIAENASAAHAVLQPRTGLRAVNFWTNEPARAAGITCDRIASVLVREEAGILHLAVADPTQGNSGAIHLTVDRRAAAVLAADGAIVTDSLAPVLRLTINVKDARGRTQLARFRLAGR